jgi:hypothetical protein
VALIAIAADKGAPGVTTTAMALTAVWPRPILLAECDPSGGDLVYRFPSAAGGHLDPRRGVLSLGIAARRGMPAQQAWEHVQKMQGGMDLLAGVTNAEQGAGLNTLWGPIGRLLAGLPQADVIADCGRIGVDNPVYDLLAEASLILLVSRAGIADVIRLRDRVVALSAATEQRRRPARIGVLVLADPKQLSSALGEVQHVLNQGSGSAKVLGGLPDDPRGAQLFRAGQVGKLNKTLLVRTARGIAKQIVGGLPEQQAQAQPDQPEQAQQPAPAQPGLAPQTLAQPALGQQTLGQPALGQPALGQQILAQQTPGQPLHPQSAHRRPELPQSALGSGGSRGTNPPGVLVASRNAGTGSSAATGSDGNGRHNKTGQQPALPGQPPANLFPPQAQPSGQLQPLPPSTQAQPGQPAAAPPVLRPVPAREQSGRG